MTRRPPPSSGSLDETPQSFGGEIRRQEAWLDQLAQVRRWGVYVLFLDVILAAVMLGLAIAVAIVTFAVHLLVPQLGWLTTEQWALLTSWYSGVARTALPLLLVLNPWIIWRLTRPTSPPD